MDDVKREHLFISYAGEDIQFAHWLARRLVAEGYRVWCDHLKLLGGESYPLHIDDAITHRTFRMLALLSRHSVRKPNPLKERTKALNIARQHGPTDFLIPLKIDDLPVDELDWMTSDLTFIPFDRSWWTGLVQLMKKLESLDCPRPLEDGRSIVAQSASENDVVIARNETLVSNCLKFTRIPRFVRAYKLTHTMTQDLRWWANRDWPFYFVNPHTVLAFHAPPAIIDQWLGVEMEYETEWRQGAVIERLDPQHVVSALLRRCLQARLTERGFVYSRDSELCYLNRPSKHWLTCTLPDERRTRFRAAGKRNFWSPANHDQPYKYYLAPTFAIRRDVLEDFVVIVNTRFHFEDMDSAVLPPGKRNSRRKHLTKNWNNTDWLRRVLGVCQFLGDQKGTITWGNNDDDQLVIDMSPLTFQAPCGIDEAKLDESKEPIEAFFAEAEVKIGE